MREIEVQLLNKTNWITIIENTYKNRNRTKLLASKEKFYNLNYLVRFECVLDSIASKTDSPTYSIYLQFVNSDCSVTCSKMPEDFKIKLLAIVNNIEFETMKSRYVKSGNANQT